MLSPIAFAVARYIECDCISVRYPFIDNCPFVDRWMILVKSLWTLISRWQRDFQILYAWILLLSFSCRNVSGLNCVTICMGC